MTSAPARIACSVAVAACGEPSRRRTAIVDDVAALLAQPREERRLVLVALLGDEVGELVAAVRAVRSPRAASSSSVVRYGQAR